jgi:hypothetical protein
MSVQPENRETGQRWIATAIGVVGLVLVLLMLAALVLPGLPMNRPAAGRMAEAVVLLPTQADWLRFRQGVDACVSRGLARLELANDQFVVLRTRNGNARMRFRLEAAVGAWEVRQAIATLESRDSRCLAVIGSSNSALTAEAARALNERSADRGGDSPLLLIPSATALSVEARSEPTGDAAGTVALLDLYPERSFRFCLSNERLASLAVDAARIRFAVRPKAIYLVVDPEDPYSRDLAPAFGRALAYSDVLEIPNVEQIILRSDPTTAGREAELDRVAREIWTSVRTHAPVWIAMTMQGNAARSFLSRLSDSRPSDLDAGRLLVLGGDGLGRQSLVQLAGRIHVPVLCASSESPGALARSRDEPPIVEGQVDAEIAAVLIQAIDQGLATPETLREWLDRLEIEPPRPTAVAGRSIVLRERERAGRDIGQVLELRPGSETLYSVVPETGGGWAEFLWNGSRWVAGSDGGAAP